MAFKIQSPWNRPNGEKQAREVIERWHLSPSVVGLLQRGQMAVHTCVYRYMPLINRKQLPHGCVSELSYQFLEQHFTCCSTDNLVYEVLLSSADTKGTTKLTYCHKVSVTVVLTSVNLTVFWIALQIINQIPPQSDTSVISDLNSLYEGIWYIYLIAQQTPNTPI